MEKDVSEPKELLSNAESICADVSVIADRSGNAVSTAILAREESAIKVVPAAKPVLNATDARLLLSLFIKCGDQVPVGFEVTPQYRDTHCFDNRRFLRL